MRYLKIFLPARLPLLFSLWSGCYSAHHPTRLAGGDHHQSSWCCQVDYEDDDATMLVTRHALLPHASCCQMHVSQQPRSPTDFIGSLTGIDIVAVSIFVQGAFFNCSVQISVLKRKTLSNQRGSFVHQEFYGTESLIGCPSFFILALKIGRNSKKKHPVWVLY